MLITFFRHNPALFVQIHKISIRLISIINIIDVRRITVGKELLLNTLSADNENIFIRKSPFFFIPFDPIQHLFHTVADIRSF